MRVKEKDLVIGHEYYLDGKQITSGIFVGFDSVNYPRFYPTKNNGFIVSPEPNGTIDFPKSDYEYEEV